MSHLDGLFGVRTVLVNGVEVPTRGKIDFVGEGVTSEDDIEAGVTRLNFVPAEGLDVAYTVLEDEDAELLASTSGRYTMRAEAQTDDREVTLGFSDTPVRGRAVRIRWVVQPASKTLTVLNGAMHASTEHVFADFDQEAIFVFNGDDWEFQSTEAL